MEEPKDGIFELTSVVSYIRSMLTRDVVIDGPFDLERTLRTLGVGRLDDDRRWWWATRTTDGIATIAIERTHEGVVANAWGPGADVLLDRLARLVAADDDYTFESAEQPMRDILARTHGLRLGSTGDVHEAIVTAVLGQVVTKTEGKRSLRSITTELGIDAPGPNASLRVFPSPEILAGLSYDELHSHGVERKRATTVIEVSRRSKRLEEILTMDAADANRRLLAVRGVGGWTAGIVMGQAYGDRDALPVGDYHLPNMVSWALAGEPRGDDNRMIELLEPYRPYRRHALLAIKQAGISAPKYGPRTAVRTHL
jgi:3-methyladenine DNA glycosylase/8-oxoguanine DNA glycosylase